MRDVIRCPFLRPLFLSCVRAVRSTHAHINQGYVLLHSFVTSTLRECQVPHELSSRTKYLRGRGAARVSQDRRGCRRRCYSLPSRGRVPTKGLMLGVTVAYPLSRGDGDGDGGRGGHLRELHPEPERAIRSTRRSKPLSPFGKALAILPVYQIPPRYFSSAETASRACEVYR